MTREEAIKVIRKMLAYTDLNVRANLTADMVDACHLAIKALEQEPFKPMVEIDLDYVIKQKYIEREVLDKIRAEIEPTRKMYFDMNDIDWVNGCDYVLSVIDKYKAETEEI